MEKQNQKPTELLNDFDNVVKNANFTEKERGYIQLALSKDNQQLKQSIIKFGNRIRNINESKNNNPNAKNVEEKIFINELRAIIIRMRNLENNKSKTKKVQEKPKKVQEKPKIGGNIKNKLKLKTKRNNRHFNLKKNRITKRRTH